MEFVKYQGTGNDFIIIDDRNGETRIPDVAALCHRRFGIGADGLMMVRSKEGYDFEMVYYNSDGNLSSMCGNGGRCIAHYAHTLGLGSENSVSFIATDGPHKAEINGNMVALGMKDVSGVEIRDGQVFVLNTGSPHYVWFCPDPIAEMDLVSYARSVRYNSEFAKEGVNVNVVEIQGEELFMRTYERGVEDETYSCGTGVTAAALAFQVYRNSDISPVNVRTPGGSLEVFSKRTGNQFDNVILKGPALKVFQGRV